jgi:hypothetical protein
LKHHELLASRLGGIRVLSTHTFETSRKFLGTPASADLLALAAQVDPPKKAGTGPPTLLSNHITPAAAPAVLCVHACAATTLYYNHLCHPGREYFTRIIFCLGCLGGLIQNDDGEREYLLACPPARARARDETNPRRKTTPYRSTGPFWYEREQHDLSVQETGGQQPWAGAVWNHVLTLADVLPDGTKPYVPAARERAFQRASSSASCISLRLPRAVRVTYVLITCVIRADTMWSVPYHGHSLGNQVARQRGEYFPAGTGDLVLSV